MSKILISIVIGYFIGSIPFCVLTAKLYGIDLSKIGSGNLGGTNLSRAVGWKIAIWPSIMDGVKTFIAAAFVFYVIKFEGTLILYAAVAAAFGHVYPWWNKFKGGKGVATMIGLSYVVLPFHIALSILLLMLIIVKTARIMTYASMTSISLIFASSFIWKKSILYDFTGINTWMFVFVVWLLVVYKHKHNLARVLKGDERKC